MLLVAAGGLSRTRKARLACGTGDSPKAWVSLLGRKQSALFRYDMLSAPYTLSIRGGAQRRVSRPQELPPQSLAEPCVSLSTHTAPIVQPRAHRALQ
jgi:hypothetical protein